MTARILVVDDDPIVRDVILRVFEEMGYATTAVASGEEAVSLMMGPETPFELVLVDMTMRGMDGVQTCQLIRKVRPEIRLMLMSGYSEEELMSTPIVRRFVDGFIHKPFRLSDLKATVGEVLEGVETSDELAVEAICRKA